LGGGLDVLLLHPASSTKVTAASSVTARRLSRDLLRSRAGPMFPLECSLPLGLRGPDGHRAGSVPGPAASRRPPRRHNLRNVCIAASVPPAARRERQPPPALSGWPRRRGTPMTAGHPTVTVPPFPGPREPGHPGSWPARPTGNGSVSPATGRPRPETPAGLARDHLPGERQPVAATAVGESWAAAAEYRCRIIHLPMRNLSLFVTT
jgi:hypothetical protein